MTVYSKQGTIVNWAGPGCAGVLDEGRAEALAEGQFLALLDRPQVVRGVTVNPGDEELQAYLGCYAAPVLARPRFLPGLEVEVRPVFDRMEGMEQRIRELTAEGLSIRAVQQQVFGYVGGRLMVC